VWLPSFATDRIERERRPPAPEPRATLLAIGNRRLLAAVNAVAAREGLRPGLALADARALVPELVVAPATPDEDARALARLAAWCGRFSPWTAPEGEDGLFLDITGCAHLFGGEAALRADLLARLGALGFAARAAIAATPGAAWALARQGDGGDIARQGDGGDIARQGGGEGDLAGLPVTALRLPDALAADLIRLGLATVGAVEAVPRPALVRRFGPLLVRRLDQIFGRLDEPIAPLAPVAPLRVRQAFAEPIAAPEQIAAVARDLIETLCARLAAEEKGLRRLALVFFRVDGTRLEASVATARPLRDSRRLTRLIGERLATLDPGFGIDLALAEARRAEPLGAAQPALLCSTTAASDDALADLVDRLAVRCGPDAVLRLGPRESHVPERAVGRIAPLAAAPAFPPGPTRPLRLFARPEPVSALGDGPDTAPEALTWRQTLLRLRRAEGPERIAPEWWRDAEGAPARDYWRVEDEAGRRFWLYREAPGRWFLQGVFA